MHGPPLTAHCISIGRHRLNKAVHPGKDAVVCVYVSMSLCMCGSFPGNGDETDRPFALIALLHSRQIGVYGVYFIFYFFSYSCFSLLFERRGRHFVGCFFAFFCALSFSCIVSRCLVFPFVEIQGDVMYFLFPPRPSCSSTFFGLEQIWLVKINQDR